MKIEVQNPEQLGRLGKEIADKMGPLKSLGSLGLLAPPPVREFPKTRHQNARLEDILSALHESSERTGRRLVWLTVALVVLTAWLLVLTAMLVVAV